MKAILKEIKTNLKGFASVKIEEDEDQISLFVGGLFSKKDIEELTNDEIVEKVFNFKKKYINFLVEFTALAKAKGKTTVTSLQNKPFSNFVSEFLFDEEVLSDTFYNSEDMDGCAGQMLAEIERIEKELKAKKIKAYYCPYEEDIFVLKKIEGTISTLPFHKIVFNKGKIIIGEEAFASFGEWIEVVTHEKQEQKIKELFDKKNVPQVKNKLTKAFSKILAEAELYALEGMERLINENSKIADSIMNNTFEISVHFLDKRGEPQIYEMEPKNRLMYHKLFWGSKKNNPFEEGVWLFIDGEKRNISQHVLIHQMVMKFPIIRNLKFQSRGNQDE